MINSLYINTLVVVVDYLYATAVLEQTDRCGSSTLSVVPTTTKTFTRVMNSNNIDISATLSDTVHFI